MQNLRFHGHAPYRVAVVHGGPGAPGSMAPVARELAAHRGVLEPLQTADSIEGQVDELRTVLQTHGTPPMALIGWSWGAWLALITTAQHPALVSRLVLVGSGPFESRDAADIMPTRLSRLDAAARAEIDALSRRLADPARENRDEVLARMGSLLSSADTYDPLPVANDTVTFQGNIYRRVWGEAEVLRKRGALLALAGRVRCPVLAIHGDHDP
ncbi:MAG TPA: alpha/beta hydrolase, partial [Chloroflexi bacterium]|nr:alpha/beta hydrolase [Chloroflexota bacterium]